MNTQTATISMPLTGIKPLYRNDRDDTLVIEVKMDELRNLNEPATIDDIVSQANIDYALGDYQSFDNTDDLIKDLHS